IPNPTPTTPSILRPAVPAKDRLAHWTSSFALSNRSLSIPAADRQRRFDIILSSLDEKTRSNYGAGLIRFHDFCDSRNISESTRMPASDELLATFIASWAGERSDSTLRTWLSGLHFWHTANGALWLEGPQCAAVMKGAKKIVPVTSRRPKRAPVTPNHLVILRQNLVLSNTFDAAVYGVACTAFWGICRLGELVPPSENAFIPSKHVSRACGHKSSTTNNGGAYETFVVPRTKTS
ncbi:hypothetical protein M407DRAFT_38546, partial [Tulasnella calospora MUT 4182]